MLRLAVRDSGIGITTEQIVRLFQPFSQADTSTTRRFGGTGLGLIISPRMAQLLGGDITVESEVGVGSTFTLTLPGGPIREVQMIDPRQASNTEPLTASMPKPVAGNQLAGCRILLAEAGPDNQRVISYVLQKAGAKVTVVDNGRKAIEECTADGSVTGPPCEQPPFDIILMDMQMPEMDGYAAAGLLRDSGHRIPVIALTAHAMSGEREKCLVAGCDDYATKPIDRSKLINMISRHALSLSPNRAALRQNTFTPAI